MFQTIFIIAYPNIIWIPIQGVLKPSEKMIAITTTIAKALENLNISKAPLI